MSIPPRNNQVPPLLVPGTPGQKRAVPTPSPALSRRHQDKRQQLGDTSASEQSDTASVSAASDALPATATPHASASNLPDDIREVHESTPTRLAFPTQTITGSARRYYTTGLKSEMLQSIRRKVGGNESGTAREYRIADPFEQQEAASRTTSTSPPLSLSSTGLQTPTAQHMQHKTGINKPSSRTSSCDDKSFVDLFATHRPREGTNDEAETSRDEAESASNEEHSGSEQLDGSEDEPSSDDDQSSEDADSDGDMPNSDWMETNPGYEQMDNVTKLYTRLYWQASKDFRVYRFKRCWRAAISLYIKANLPRYTRVDTLILLANLVPSNVTEWMREALDVCDDMNRIKNTPLDIKTIGKRRALCHKVLATYNTEEYADGSRDRVKHRPFLQVKKKATENVREVAEKMEEVSLTVRKHPGVNPLGGYLTNLRFGGPGMREETMRTPSPPSGIRPSVEAGIGATPVIRQGRELAQGRPGRPTMTDMFAPLTPTTPRGQDVERPGALRLSTFGASQPSQDGDRGGMHGEMQGVQDAARRYITPQSQEDSQEANQQEDTMEE